MPGGASGALRLLPAATVAAAGADGRLALAGPLRDIGWRPAVGAAQALDALMVGVPIAMSGEAPVLPASLGPPGLALALLRGGQAELRVRLGEGAEAWFRSMRPGATWRSAPATDRPWRLVADAGLEPSGDAAGGARLAAGGTAVLAELPPGPWIAALFAPWRGDGADPLACALRWAGLAEPACTAKPAWAARGWTASEWRFHAATTDPGPSLQDDRPDLPPEPPPPPGIALPVPPETPLARLMAARRSQRHHAQGGLPLAPFAAVLHSALRDLGPVEADTPALRRRPYPSAGARQALDWFVAAGDIPGLAPALYRYDPLAHSLAPVGAAGPPADLLREAAAAWGAPENPPQAVLLAACRLARLTPRYAGLAYRLALIEAGCALQALSLAAAEAGIGACVLGSGSASRFAGRSGLAAEAVAPIAWLAMGSSPAGRLSMAQ
jgi:SagB-type dehydrogenase family enzyme